MYGDFISVLLSCAQLTCVWYTARSRNNVYINIGGSAETRMPSQPSQAKPAGRRCWSSLWKLHSYNGAYAYLHLRIRSIFEMKFDIKQCNSQRLANGQKQASWKIKKILKLSWILLLFKNAIVILYTICFCMKFDTVFTTFSIKYYSKIIMQSLLL